jgi:hypothetical protein
MPRVIHAKIPRGELPLHERPSRPMCEEIDAYIHNYSIRGLPRFFRTLGKAARACRRGDNNLAIYLLVEAGGHRVDDLRKRRIKLAKKYR